MKLRNFARLLLPGASRFPLAAAGLLCLFVPVFGKAQVPVQEMVVANGLPQRAGGGPAGPPVETLKDAMQSAIDSNAELAFERLRLEQSRASVGVAFSEWLPRLLFSHNTGVKSVTSNAVVADRKNYNYQYNDFSLEFRQNLFDGFATRHRWAKAELQFRVDELRMAQRLQQKSYEVINAYIDVQRARSSYIDIREARNRVGSLLEKIRNRGTEGMVALVEVSRVESRHLALENQLYEQYRVRVAAENAFYQLTRRRLGGYPAAVVPYGGYSVEDLDAIPLSRVLDQANQHPLRLQAQLLQDVRVHERGEAQSGYFPKVDFIVRRSTGSNTNGYIDAPGSRQNDTTALVSMSWNVFEGFGTTKRVDTAAYAQEASYYATMDVADRVEEKVSNAWQDLQTVSSRIKVARTGAKAATETAAKYEELVLTGRRSLVEGVNVIEELMRARIELTTQQYQALLQSYKLAYEIGVLDTSVVVQSSALPSKPAQP